jgi:hypothetical protein
MNKRSWTLLVLCCTFASAARVPEVRHIDLAVTNHLETEIDVVVKQSPSHAASSYSQSGLSMLSWPLLKVQPQQTEKTETFTDLDEGSKVDIYIFKSKELDETDLLLSSMANSGMEHVGTASCAVENQVLACKGDELVTVSQYDGYTAFYLGLSVG